VGHYGGSYKVTYDLYKKFGEQRLLDTPICGMLLSIRALCLSVKSCSLHTIITSSCSPDFVHSGKSCPVRAGLCLMLSMSALYLL
jgi:hypothetical protein